MSRVLAFHLVITAYGFWLPNDPRGSWSTFVRAFELYRVGGPATKVHTRRSVAHVKHDATARAAAKAALAHRPVVFRGEQARAIMQGMGDYATKNHRMVFAAAVMPDHVHLVVRRDALDGDTLAEQFKARATTFLNHAGLHPFADVVDGRGRHPSPWARHAWPVFLDSVDDIRRAVRYVEANPIKAGYRPQRYAWVTEYRG
jgi:REP element-mobilizing transposase RayT